MEDITETIDVVEGVPTRRRNLNTPEAVGVISGAKDDTNYSMNYSKRGLCYIFNHKIFKPRLKLKERSGTDIDVQQLQQLFERLGFAVFIFNDYKTKMVLYQLQEASRVDHTDYSCFVCCILTYGKPDKLYAADDKYATLRVFERFHGDRCPTLAGKPKIFLIQACPIDKADSKQQKAVYNSTDHRDKSSFRIPTRADFLIVHSTVPGFYSWRNTSNGSWFVQALCATLEKHVGNMDLLQLLKIVNRRMAFYFNNCDSSENMDKKMEVACVTSTLTRNIKFPIPCCLDSEVPNVDTVKSFSYVSEDYCLNGTSRGKCYIFNHETYKDDKILRYKRTGTNLDAKDLKDIFVKLNFDTMVFDNPERKTILEELQKVCEKSQKEYSCFVCFILTHGNYGELQAYDQYYPVNEIFDPFIHDTHKTWIGKPKIFFMQACQGDMLDSGINIKCKDSTDSPDEGFNFRHFIHPDFLIVSSTVPGFFSWRNPTNGAWFIQTLCETLQQHVKDMDFLQLLTRVNHQVAFDFKSRTEEKETNKKKQTFCMTSTLTRNIKF